MAGSFYVFSLLATLLLCSIFHLPTETITKQETPFSYIEAYKKTFTNIKFIGYGLISTVAFACHFSFIILSPVIFIHHLGMSNYEYGVALLFYSIAYIAGGSLAMLLNKYLTPSTLINIGLILIITAGVSLLLFMATYPLSAITILVPVIICTAGTTLTRPAATTLAMDLFPKDAGTAASTAGILAFAVGGSISGILSFSPYEPQLTLGIAFIALSGCSLLTHTQLSIFKSTKASKQST